MLDNLKYVAGFISDYWLIALIIAAIIWKIREMPAERDAAMAVPMQDVHKALFLLKQHGGRIDFDEFEPPFSEPIARRAVMEGWMTWSYDGGGGGSTGEIFELTDEGRALMGLEPKPTVLEYVAKALRLRA